MKDIWMLVWFIEYKETGSRSLATEHANDITYWMESDCPYGETEEADDSQPAGQGSSDSPEDSSP